MAEESAGWIEELRWLRALARHLVTDGETADDLAQAAALLSLARSPDPDPADRGWRAGVIRRLALHGYRGEARRRRREAIAARPERLTSSDEIVERLEIHQQLIEAILALGEEERRLVVLRYFEDRSSADIAHEAKEPEATVRSRLRRALAALRAELDRRSGGDRRKWAVPLVAWLGLSSGGAADLAAVEGVGAEAVGRVTAPVPPSPSRPTPPPSPLPLPPSLALEGGLIVAGKKIAVVAGVIIAAGALWWFADGSRGVPSRGTEPRTVAGDRAARESGAAVAAADPADEPAPSDESAGDRILLAGSILDRRDDSPVSGARVIVLDGDREVARAIAGADGRYALAAPLLRESASLRIVADAPEHVAAALDLPGTTMPWPDLLPPLHLSRGFPVEGRALTEEGSPVVGARVIAFAPTRVETAMGGGSDPLVRRGGELPLAQVTDAEGSFRIVLPPGEAVLLATAPGLFGTGVLVRPGDLPHEFELTLSDAQPWSGTVVDENGNSIEGARVVDYGDSLTTMDGITFGGSSRDTRVIRTDSRGRFEVAPRAAEPGQLRVEHPGFLPATREREAMTGEERSSRALSPIVLRRARAVRGRLTDSAGVPAAAGTSIILAIGSRTLESRIQQNGEFIVRGVSPLDGGGELRIPGALDLDLTWNPGAEEHDLGVLVLDRGRSIRVRVIDSAGSPVAGAAVRAGARQTRTGQIPEAFARTESDGTALLEGLAAGPITLSVWALSFALQDVEIAEHEDGATREVRLDAPADLRGRLVDATGEPLVGAVVSLALATDRVGGREIENHLPREGPTGRLSAVSGVAGEFRFPELPPGVDLRLMTEPRGRFPASATIPGLLPGETREAGDVSLGGAGRLEVQVIGMGRESLAGALVEVASVIEEGARWRSLPRVSVFTDSDGTAIIEGLTSGPHVIEIRHGESVSWREQIEHDGGDQRIDVTLEPGVAWDVEVLDERGAPVLGARVKAFSTRPNGRQISGTTDRTGRARIVPIPADPVRYSVESTDHVSLQWGSAPGSELPARIVLAAGGKLRIEIDRPTGGPPLDEIRFNIDSPNRHAGSSADAIAGKATIGQLAPGTYQVRVESSGYTTHSEEVQIVAGQETVVVYRPEPDVRPIEIRLVDREDRPVPGARVFVDTQLPVRLRVPLADKGGGIYRGSVPLAVETADILVLPAAHSPLRVQGVDSRESPIRVVVGPSATLELVARDGREAPIPGLKVEIEGPDSALPHPNALLVRLITQRTDDSGRMELEGLPPGTHTIILARDRLALSRTQIELVEGKTSTLEVTVPILIEVSGRVVAAGRVLVPESVVVRNAGSLVHLSVDADGSFRGLAPESEGTDFLVRIGEFFIDFPDVAVEPGREVILGFEPVAGELRCLGPSGEPIGDFRLLLNRPSVFLTDPRNAGGDWFGAIAVAGNGLAPYSDLRAGRYRVMATDLDEQYALGIDEIELVGGDQSIPIVASERVIVRSSEAGHPVDVTRIGADGVWRQYRPTGRGPEVAHIGPHDPSPGLFVIEAHGFAPELVITDAGAPSEPVVVSQLPGGMVVLPPLASSSRPVHSVRIDALGAAEVAEPLRIRPWDGVGSLSISLPVGRFRVAVHGASGPIATCEVEIRALEPNVLEW